MKSMQVLRVIFAIEPKSLVGAILRPAAWPNFKSQSEELRHALSLLPDWRVEAEERKANCGAFLIARSVTREERSQLYVAQSYHFWLQKLFEDDRCIT